MHPITILRVVLLTISITSALALTRSDERIRRAGYPVEKHMVQTKDGYILTMFRIPHPAHWKGNSSRPIAFLQHGMLSSSDCWLLNGPGMALAYMFVDAGYDVWLGNNRGNTYSRRHAFYSPSFPGFWHFEWHEMGLYDMPVMIDYALSQTGQESLHYIAHSQGTTVLFVLTSLKPEYNAKIKSAQLISPIAFMYHAWGPIVSALTPLGQPEAPMKALGSMEYLPFSSLVRAIAAKACVHDMPSFYYCTSFMFAFYGWDREGFNVSMFNDIIDTHPAGASMNQVIHFAQERLSGHFRQFDHGYLRNLLIYGQFEPPDYDVRKIKVPAFLYYADNDFVAHNKDVEKLARMLPNVKYKFRVPNPKWNHLDHLWGYNVKEIIYDKVLANVNEMESNG